MTRQWNFSSPNSLKQKTFLFLILTIFSFAACETVPTQPDAVSQDAFHTTNPSYVTGPPVRESSQQSSYMEKPIVRPVAHYAPANQAPIQRRPIISGPKRTIAVGKFDAHGGFVARYGNWDVGGGLSAMLVTALKDSGAFVVVDRSHLDRVFVEQELTGSGLVRGETGAQIGKLKGAQLLVFGSVTEFSEQDQGNSFSFGIVNGPFSGALNPTKTSGKIAIDIRVVDTTSSETVHSIRVVETISRSSLGLGFGYKNINVANNSFSKTPLGEVTRRAINQAVFRLSREINNTAWKGRVVAFDSREVAINAGQKSGLRVGDRFKIVRVEGALTDPESGDVIWKKEKELGAIQVTRVEEKIAFGTFSPKGREYPKRNDLVVVWQ